MIGQAKDTFFVAPLIEPKESPCHYVSNGNCGLMVLMSISGIQRNLGRGFIDAEMASRFADMASLRFRKYRRRLEWNYSEAQAIADTANDEDNGGKLVNWILGRIHNEIRSSLKECSAPKNPAELKANRRTAKAALASLESRIVISELRIDRLEKSLSDLADKAFRNQAPAPDNPPISYPQVTCIDPDNNQLAVIKTVPTIWKGKT